MSPSHVFVDCKNFFIVYMCDAFDYLKVSIKSPLFLLWTRVVRPISDNRSSYVLCLNPSIILVALHCTFSRTSWSFFSCGHHACTQYFSLGWTRALYNFIILFLSFHFIFLFIIPRIWLALLTATLHCSEVFPLLCTIIPRSRSCSTFFKFCPPSSYVCFSFLVPKCITTHLTRLNNICQSSDHL